MRSEFKSATHIYVNPIHFEIQLILRNDLFSHDDQNWWNQKNCPKFFHRVISAFWIQICNPNLYKSIYFIFWITANIEKWSFFCIPGPDDQNRWNRKNRPTFFYRVIFAFWIQIWTHIYVNPIHFEIQLILRNDLFSHDDQNWWN